MRFNVSHLVKAPLGARDVVHLDQKVVTLGDDLVLHYLRGDVRFTRTTDGLLAEGRLQTALDSECVRCLASFALPLTLQLDDLIFTLPQIPVRDNQYRIMDSGWINATAALREQIFLSVPLQSLCRPDCKGLCAQCGQDLNVGTCDCSEQPTDPRLEILRDLL